MRQVVQNTIGKCVTAKQFPKNIKTDEDTCYT